MEARSRTESEVKADARRAAVNKGAGHKASRVGPGEQARPGAWGIAFGLAAVLIFFLAARRASAQTLSAPAAYNMQPGTIAVGVATGYFESSGGNLLDFAVLEQAPASGAYQVEVFHGQSNGTFCTNCAQAGTNPDLISLGAGVKGNAIAVGQFRAGSAPDIAVATSTGIVFLQNEKKWLRNFHSRFNGYDHHGQRLRHPDRWKFLWRHDPRYRRRHPGCEWRRQLRRL